MNNQLQILILAGGYSSRMGTDKALLEIEEIPVVDMIIGKLIKISSDITLVCGANYPDLKAHKFPEVVKLVKNPDPQDGMFSSIKAGVVAMKDSGFIMIHLIDQPFIQLQTYQLLHSKLDDSHLVFKPGNSSKKASGHPIIIHHKILQMIKNAPEESTLRDVLQQIPKNMTKRIDTVDDHIFDNINTLAILNEIKKENNGNHI